MVKVYYEQKGYAELTAYFDSEETYAVCVEALEKHAKECNFEFITESVNELGLMELDTIIEPILNNEKTYYLFGDDAVREYDDNGIDGVCAESEANEITVTTFVFIEGVTRSADFADAINGWNRYAILTEEEYNKL